MLVNKKFILCIVAAAATAFLPQCGYTLPQDPSVKSGSVDVTRNGQELTVNASDQAIIDWHSFNIAPDEIVRFWQPSSQATVLNRIIGGSSTDIAGQLFSNGILFLINPAGIHFASTAVVEVGGLIASSLDLSNEQFLSRRYEFLNSGAAPGSVINEGQLHAADGGVIALLGSSVANRGTITARLGTVALAAGDKAVLNFEPDGFVGVAVEDPVTAGVIGPDGKIQDPAFNSGRIEAPGGFVQVTARALQGIFDHVINQTGVIEAQGVQEHTGRVFLVGYGGAVRFPAGGLINVSGDPAGGDGGFVEVSGDTLELGGQMIGSAQDGYRGGRLLVDPFNIIFNTSTQPTPPNNASGTPDIAFNAAPAAGTTIIEIADIVGFAEAWFEATQDITVNNPLTMNNNNDLVLRAGRNINLNANVRVQGGSGHMTLVADSDFSASGGAASDGVGTINQAAGTTIQAGNGNMILQTGGDFTARNITNGNGGLVSITSTHGNILDDGNAATRITSGTVTLTANAAGKGVGTTGELNTDVNNLTLNVGSGGATVHDIGNFTLNAPTVASGGSLNLRADGNITLANGAAVSVGGAGTINLLADADGNGSGTLVMNNGSSLVSAGGNITISGSDDLIIRTLSAGAGSINITGVGTGTDILDDGNGATQITAGSLTLTAAGTIGNSTTPVSATVTHGTWTVNAGSADGAGIAVNAAGSVSPVDTLTFSGTPPGTILYNGNQLFPVIVPPPPVIPPTPNPTPNPAPTVSTISTTALDFRSFFAPLVELLRQPHRPSVDSL